MLSATLDSGISAFDSNLLTHDAKAVYDAGLAGGSGLNARALAMDVLCRAHGARLAGLENSIQYTDPLGKRAGFLAKIGEIPFGVTVGRAYHYPENIDLSPAEVTALLEALLDRVNQTNLNVAPASTWSKHILVIFAYNATAVSSLELAWNSTSASLKSNTVLYVIRTDGNDTEIY